MVRIRLNLGRARKKGATEIPPAVLRLRRWLSPASAVALLMALWRLACDLGLAGRFAVPQGLFSHWQVWMALAIILQVLDMKLGRDDRTGPATS